MRDADEKIYVPESTQFDAVQIFPDHPLWIDYRVGEKELASNIRDYFHCAFSGGDDIYRFGKCVHVKAETGKRFIVTVTEVPE